MASVEDQIVGMKFDNKQFEPAAKQTMSTLDRLKAALNFGTTKSKGLDDIQAKANRFSMDKVSSAVQSVAPKFSAMSVVAIAALANIASRAVDVGLRVGKALTIKPALDGFREYELKLGSVQTILSNTQASGATLKDVNSTLAELNAYSDQTIYNFGEMAKNIGTFTAAGVDLETATGSIKGIANLAALSGSNSQQASTAMYQLSQAISAGRVGLQDWNSVVNAGMGGTVFQRALAQTAEKMGTLDKGAVKLTGKMKNATINGKSFRESITAKPGEQSWLTSKVLTTTLKNFTGDMSKAELVAEGWSDAQAQAIVDQAKTAKAAATEVKTVTQLIGTLQESAGSGWAQTSEILVGDFEEAKKLFTGLNNYFGDIINKSSEGRNKLLQDWKNFGGRNTLIEALGNAFTGLLSVMKPIQEAFRQIFPPVTAVQLVQLTNAFYKFTQRLTVSKATADLIKRSFAGLFAIFSIGVSAVKAILGVIGNLFGVLSENGGGFLEITASIGDFLVKLDETIKKGDVFNKFFGTLGNVIGGVIGSIVQIAKAIGDFFGSIDLGPMAALGAFFDRLGDRMSPLGKIAGVVKDAFSGLIGSLSGLGDFMGPLIDGISGALGGLGNAIGDALRTGDFSGAFDALNTVLLGGILVVIKKFFDGGFNLNIDAGGGFLSAIKDTLGGLTDTLSAMQSQVQAKTILLIATAVGILTVSIVALSLIDSGKLTSSLVAIGVAFGYLLGAMAILTKIVGTAGFLKMPFIAASMIALATAMVIMAAAVKIMSSMSWGELVKGLGGLIVVLAAMVVVANSLGGSAVKMAAFGLAMIPLGIGLVIISKALQNFGAMSMEEIGKAMLVLGVSLGLLAGGLYLMTAALPGAAALVVASAALLLLAPALILMGSMSWRDIAAGLVALAGALIILAVGLTAMIATGPGAAALVIAAGGLLILAPALMLMGSMDWGTIAKGLVVLAASLLILAVGLTAMIAALPGAAALVVAAAALTVFVPVLAALGSLDWGTILTGLGALALTFTILGVAGMLLTPVIPAILGLAAALALLGLGTALVGVGLLAIATAFSIFVAAGTAGIAVLLGMIQLIPAFMTQFAIGIGAFAVTIAAQGAAFTAAFVVLISSLLTAVITLAPKIGIAFMVLINTMLRVVVSSAPKIGAAFLVLLNVALRVIVAAVPRIAAAGMRVILGLMSALNRGLPLILALGTRLIVNLINGIASRISAVVRAAVNLITRFLGAIGDAGGKLADAGAKMIIRLVNGVAGAIRSNQGAMNAAGRNLASAIADGLTGGLAGAVGRAASAAANLARSAANAAKAALKINSPSKVFQEFGHYSGEGLALGFEDSGTMVERSAALVANNAFDAVKRSMSGLSDLMSANVNLDPTIRPIIDLSGVAQGAAQIGGMLDQKAISADLSYRQALGVSAGMNRASDSGDSAKQVIIQKSVNLTQNNTSPQYLSEVDIYRKTHNQLDMAKEALEGNEVDF